MIRHAAAYATVATIGSVVGTFVGCVFGVAIIAALSANRTTNVSTFNYGSTDAPKAGADGKS